MSSYDNLPFMKFLNLFCGNFVHQRGRIEYIEGDVMHPPALVFHLQGFVESPGQYAVISHGAVVIATVS